jgi:carboxyl-terminal processing protease
MLNLMFADEGYLLLSLIYKDSTENIYSTGRQSRGTWQPRSIIVLIDEGSASASEVFAGTLQAYGIVETVGVATVGKAHMQHHITLPSNDILVISVAAIELHGIGMYEERGIVPIHEVEIETRIGRELELGALYPERAFFRNTSQTNRVRSMQERLQLLGFYRIMPNGIFDDYTLWSLNRFQIANGLRKTPFASAPALRELERISDEWEFSEDTQLEYAIAMSLSR